jgi:hypothetical protein
MNSGEIDRFPLGQLSARYDGLARSAVYKRMDALGIKPLKVGNKGFVDGEQLAWMDELHAFLNAGGNTAEFLEKKGVAPAATEASSGLSAATPDIFKLVATIAAQMRPPATQPDPFAYLETLERSARNGWLLKTSELSYLLDLPVTEIERYYGDRFTEAGFVFTKAGFRSRGEVAWKVSKP